MVFREVLSFAVLPTTSAQFNYRADRKTDLFTRSPPSLRRILHPLSCTINARMLRLPMAPIHEEQGSSGVRTILEGDY